MPDGRALIYHVGGLTGWHWLWMGWRSDYVRARFVARRWIADVRSKNIPVDFSQGRLVVQLPSHTAWELFEDRRGVIDVRQVDYEAIPVVGL